MDVFSTPPFTLGTLKWQETPGQWTLTLICKLTLAIGDESIGLAAEQEPIHRQERFWDDDPAGAVYAPSDLVPFRPRPQVVLVGSVFPRGAAGAIDARLGIGTLDKIVEVETRGESAAIAGFGPIEAIWPDGAGPSAVSPGPDSRLGSPIGMEGQEGLFHCAPEDQRPDELLPDDPIALGYLHPAHEHWVSRLPGIRPRTRVEIDGMPPWELDLVLDTLWIDTHRSICTLVWRGQLPLDGPDQPGRIFVGVERPGEVALFPDAPAETQRKPPVDSGPSDDDEQTQTNDDALEKTGVQPVPFASSPALPFQRGNPVQLAPSPVPKPRPRAPAQDLGETSVYQAKGHRSRMPTWLGGMMAPVQAGATTPATQELPAAAPVPPAAPMPPAVAALPLSPPASRAPVPPPPVAQILRSAEPPPPSLTAASNRAASVDERASVLPGASPAPPPLVSPVAMAVAPSPMPVVLPGAVVPPGGPGVPPLPGPLAVPQPAFSASSPVAGAGLLPSLGSKPTVGQSTVGQSAAGQATVGQAAVAGASPRYVPPELPPPPEEERPLPRKVDPRALATAAFLGAAEASTAAALTKDEPKQRAIKNDRVSTAGTAQPVTRTVIDFLWYAPELVPRLLENEGWKRILTPDSPPPKPAEEEIPDEELPEDAPPRKKRKPPPPPPEKTPEEKAAEERGRVTKIIARAEPAMDVEGALFSAVNDDGVLEPPLLLVPGELELPFDEVETLKVLTAAAAPLAVGDKKLKETLDLANEALGTPLGSSPEVALSFSARVRDAWVRANRILSPDYLDIHSRRVLLEQRKYQHRELLGQMWIRGLLYGPLGDKPVPTYLPLELSKKLPLFMRFPVRLIAEALPALDQNEAHPAALRVLSLARAVTGRPRR